MIGADDLATKTTTTTKKKTTRKKTTSPQKKLVIVESPSKAKTIGKYLGRSYKVVASLGHVRDLPKSRMGVDVENDYQPDYISIRGKGDVIKELRKDVKKAKAVYLASDPDREEKVRQFREQTIQVLLTTTIMERGVTFPSVDVVVLDAGHSVFDEAALVQIAGRAGRSPVDPIGDVLFLHDGKTAAMTAAIKSIQMMNRRGGFT